MFFFLLLLGIKTVFLSFPHPLSARWPSWSSSLPTRHYRCLSHQPIRPPFRFRPPSLLHNWPFASHLQLMTAMEDPMAAMEDLMAAVAANRTANPAPLGWVFWWVCTVFGLGFLVSFNWFWVGLIFGFLLILGWVDFWVSVDFGIFLCARLQCLAVALALALGYSSSLPR